MEKIAIDIKERKDIEIFFDATSGISAIKDAIRKYKHIFLCQSTILSLEDVNKLLKLSEEANVRTHVCFKVNYKLLNEIKNVVLEPAHIEIRRTSNILEQDIIYDILMSDIYFLLNIQKVPISQIIATGTSKNGRDIDFANVLIEFNNGSSATLLIDKMSDEGNTLKVFQKKDKIDINISDISRYFPEGVCIPEELNYFCRNIDNDVESESNFRNYQKVLNIVRKIEAIIRMKI
ncbi:hypothetical protein FACS1894153_1130 [Bacteroidia bacterium]|nr:hypothetical protein FACS1894153_1130 [Bacteroidia bacterium]